jgi:hypothetical protein
MLNAIMLNTFSECCYAEYQIMSKIMLSIIH